MVTLGQYIKEIRAKGKRSFTKQEALKDLGITNDSFNHRVMRLKKSGELISPAKNFYVIVPAEHKTLGSIPADELVALLMKHKKLDYYACLLTAAEYHGAAHQRAMVFQVMVTKQMPSLEFGAVKIDFVYKKSLTGLPVQDFKTAYETIKVSSPELTAMDLLQYPERSLGLSNIATIFYELIEAINPTKLMELIKLSGENSWVQRMGYILEQIDTWDEKADKRKEQIINKLEVFVSKQNPSFIALYSSLDSKACPRNSKWRIIENSNIEPDL
jgi:predicted transcriptional regulator of viral defense system